MKKRKTIGLLINDIDGNYQTLLWLMIKKAAETFDCNLIAYEGRSLDRNVYADKQHHIVYDFVDKNRVDGLVMMTGSIGNFITHEELINFCKKYNDIPRISIGTKIPGATSLIVDNREGMRNLIMHLIDDHGCRKIAFVTGPDSNIDSVERYEAYCEVLKKKGIQFDRSLIFHGDFVAQTGYRIMKQILEQDINFDAVVYSNDDMALAALKCIKDLKKPDNDRGRELIICGFDDTINSSLVKPSLTTVRQPLEEICNSSVELLLRKIDGEKIDDIVTFPSVLVKRESCGCICDNNADIDFDSYLRLVPGYRIHENVQTYLMDELFDNITDSISECNIRSCFISKYFDTILYDGDFQSDASAALPKESDLIYAYYDNRDIPIDDSIKRYNTKLILPEKFLPADRRFTYLINPLFFKNEHFGFVCFEVENDDVINFEPLRGQISNAIKGALMVKEREKMEEYLVESERLALLGHLIGGLSHNLMTPIMAIAGVTEGLEDLAKEYMQSIGDPEVTEDDHYEIASEILTWINKLREYNSYMSNVITTVKTQAVQLNSDAVNQFTIGEFVSRIKFIKDTDIKVKKSKINFSIDEEIGTVICGDLSNLVQIAYSIITNSIESYNGTGQDSIRIDFSIQRDGNSVLFIIKDYGKGIPDDVSTNLFRNMVTTKGRHGTGLSLLLCYSTIKGKFGGDIWFDTKEGQGTTFYVSIPMMRK